MGWTQQKFLPRDDRTPRTVLANYCAELQFTKDKVDSELDCDFLSDPTDTMSGDDEWHGWETGAPVSPPIHDYGPPLTMPDPYLHSVHRVCVDATHYASLIDWAYPSDSTNENVDPIFHHIPLVCPVNLPLDDAPRIDDTLFSSPIPDIPVTVMMSTHPATSTPVPSHVASLMADSGANVCITNDPLILVDICDISPVPLGVAITSTGTTPTMCTEKWYLPITTKFLLCMRTKKSSTTLRFSLWM